MLTLKEQKELDEDRAQDQREIKVFKKELQCMGWILSPSGRPPKIDRFDGVGACRGPVRITGPEHGTKRDRLNWP